MILYDESKTIPQEKKILRSDLQYLAIRLNQLINVYERNVYITNDETKHVILQLKNFLSLLKDERYDILFGDTSFIENDCGPLESLSFIDEKRLPF